MIWQKIDPDNLPKGEVLAANFRSGTCGYGDKLLGRLYVSAIKQLGISCENNTESLDNCTHYFDIESIEIPEVSDSFDCPQKPLHPGVILADALKKVGMTQGILAERMGVHPKTVEELILGDFPISTEMGALIGKALGMGDRLWFRFEQEMGVK